MFFMEKSIQEQVMVLFDYCGNIDKKHYGNYSPNNIRRLIISPDGVIVEYHLPNLVPKTNGKSYRCVDFNYMQLQQEQMQRGYKPIISLALKRVCSSIEEIIFLTQSCQYQAANFANIEARMIDIRSFVRLHYITMVNMPINQFMQGYTSIAHARFLSDVPDMQKYIISKRTVIDKWYLDWGSSKSKSTYPVEMRSLAGYFIKVKQQYEVEVKQKKQEEQEDNPDEGAEDRLEELNSLIKTYLKLYVFNEAFEQASKSGVIPYITYKKPFQFEQLYKVDGIKIEKYFLRGSGLPADEAVQHNIDYINNLNVRFTKAYFSSLVKAMNEITNNYPILAKSVLNHNEMLVAEGKFPSGVMAGITAKTGFKFIEKNIGVVKMLSGVASVYSRFFFDNPDSKYNDARYWEGLLR